MNFTWKCYVDSVNDDLLLPRFTQSCFPTVYNVKYVIIVIEVCLTLVSTLTAPFLFTNYYCKNNLYCYKPFLMNIIFLVINLNVLKT